MISFEKLLVMIVRSKRLTRDLKQYLIPRLVKHISLGLTLVWLMF